MPAKKPAVKKAQAESAPASAEGVTMAQLIVNVNKTVAALERLIAQDANARAEERAERKAEQEAEKARAAAERAERKAEQEAEKARAAEERAERKAEQEERKAYIAEERAERKAEREARKAEQEERKAYIAEERAARKAERKEREEYIAEERAARKARAVERKAEWEEWRKEWKAQTAEFGDKLAAGIDRMEESIENTLDKLGRLVGNQENARGKRVEALFRKSLPAALEGAGMPVDHVEPRALKRDGREYDFVARNGKMNFVGEIKSRFRVEDLVQLRGLLASFAEDYPDKAGDRPIYGVVCGTVVDEDAANIARKDGLLVVEGRTETKVQMPTKLRDFA